MTIFEYFPDLGFAIILIAFMLAAFFSCFAVERAERWFNRHKPQIAVLLAKVIYHEDWSDRLKQK